MEVNVLGTDYDVEIKKIDKPLDGYCDTSVKKIVVDSMENVENPKEDLERYQAQVLRHEIIHAFMYESGLEGECGWATEEMVDWLAIQFDKLAKAFVDCGCCK